MTKNRWSLSVSLMLVLSGCVSGTQENSFLLGAATEANLALQAERISVLPNPDKVEGGAVGTSDAAIAALRAGKAAAPTDGGADQ